MAQHYTVFTYDRRGTGGSGRGESPYAVEREFEDLQCLLDLAGPDASVYGFSSGATLALLAPQGLPIVRLLLNEPPLLPDPDLSPREEARRRLEQDPADARRWFDEEVTRIPAEIRATFRPLDALDLANAPAMLHELTFLPGVTADQFHAVHVLTLLMASDSTAGELRDSTQALGRALPHATVRILPGGWHGVPDDTLVAAIDEFIANDRTTGHAEVAR